MYAGKLLLGSDRAMTKTFLVTTDMSHRGDRAIQRGVFLARQHGARLVLLCVVDDAPDASIVEATRAASEKRLEAIVEDLAEGVACDIRVVAGEPVDVIVGAAEQVDLLVIGTHRHRALFDHLRETTVQRIARLTNCPILVVCDVPELAYESVVAGTDFSASSAASVRVALELAPGAQVQPVHCFHVPHAGGRLAGHDHNEPMSKEAEEADIAWRKRNALAGDHIAPTQILRGSALSGLADTVRRLDASLLVVGAHGRKGERRAFLGSTATAIMRDPPCDVLICRNSGGS